MSLSVSNHAGLKLYLRLMQILHALANIHEHTCWSFSSEGESLKSLQGQSAVAGSLFKDRIFVRSKHQRSLLLSFSSRSRGGTDGISAEDYEGLIGELSEMAAASPEATLLPFLSADEVGQRRYATVEHRVMLHILGTSAPACQFMKPVAFDIVQRIINGQMANITLDMLKPLAARCPHLWSFMRPYMGMAELPGHVTALLAALLKV